MESLTLIMFFFYSNAYLGRYPNLVVSLLTAEEKSAMPVKYRGEADTQHSYQPNKKVWRRSEESVTLTVPERGSKRPKR